jgi:glucose/arabinose dehydrogenase
MPSNPLNPCLVLLATLLGACGGGGGGGGGDGSPSPPPVVAPPPTVALERILPELRLDRPVALLQAPGDSGRWFVVEQGGIVRVVEAGTSIGAVFVDLTPVVSAGGETGLLGMAFDPDFPNNGTVYLSYTGRPAGVLTSFVTRYLSHDGGRTLDASSGEVLLQIVQEFGNHNGGHLAFGPDGLLYVGFGDGGSANDPNDRAQDTTNLLGAILRLDPRGGSPYAVPAANPFADNPTCPQGYGAAPCPEIFAWGLRNPWRWSFDSLTGRLWLGDVGQSRREEVNIVRAGENYGWRIREGADCNTNIAADCDPAGLTDPVWEYGRDEGRSITGGFVYRGTAIGGLEGHYVFGDFVTGRIWGLPVDGAGAAVELLESGVPISSFGRDMAGELYVVDYGGRLYRLVAGP